MIRITNKERCCGCSSCSSVCPAGCIALQPDEEGFLYPVIDEELCIECGLCEKKCPIINSEPEKHFKQDGFIVQIRDTAILSDSTSGGAFTLLAEHVINRGGFVYGVGFNQEGFPAHKRISKVSDIQELRGSKYVQSEIGNTFRNVKQDLEAGNEVLFSGTPCQAEGLLRYLGRQYQNLVVVDLVCHAVPSPLVYSRYLEMIGRDGFVRFRDKRPYGYQYSQISKTSDNGIVTYAAGVESDPYLRAFFSDLSVRPSCYECAFKKRYRLSDITLWDCFNPHSYDKRFNDNAGATKVICHSEAGRRMIQAVSSCSFCTQVEVERLILNEKEIVESVRKPPNRNDFFNDCKAIENADELFSKWFPLSAKRRIERKVRVALSRLGLLGFVKNGIKEMLTWGH